MALDQFGNYIADIWPVPVSPLPGSMFSGNSGVGPPSDLDGNNGDTYVNLTTGDIYTKSGDTWSIITGGLSGSGSPEGSVAGNVGQTYWDYTNKILWTKDSGDGTVNGWYQLIGP